jgi:hypothetical protein
MVLCVSPIGNRTWYRIISYHIALAFPFIHREADSQTDVAVSTPRPSSCALKAEDEDEDACSLARPIPKQTNQIEAGLEK